MIGLAVGINNASPTAAKHFQSHCQETVISLSDTAAVLVATITPVRSRAGSGGYDPMLVQDLNAVIKATPSAAGVIDLNSAPSGANWTTDGIHFGPDGYAIWKKTVVEGIHGAKSRTLRDDLAERFHELQQLRKKVSELEKRLANDHHHGAGGTRANLAGRPK